MLLSGLAACQGAPTQKRLPLRESGQADSSLSPQRGQPDAVLRELARLGIASADALSGAWREAAPLIAAIRDSRKKRTPASYRLLQVAGWSFFAGGWRHQDENWRTLRVVLDDGQNRAIGFDVVDEVNFSSGLQTTFPADMNRLRLEIDQTLPTGGQLATTLVGPLGTTGQAIVTSGLGGISQVGALDGIAFEALNAKWRGDQFLDLSEFVLKGMANGVTLHFAGEYNQHGLLKGSLRRAAGAAGEVYPAGLGAWTYQNESGSYAL